MARVTTITVNEIEPFHQVVVSNTYITKNLHKILPVTHHRHYSSHQCFAEACITCANQKLQHKQNSELVTDEIIQRS